jgi:hypothetical protein
MESLAGRCPTTRAFIHSSFNVPGLQAPPLPDSRFPSVLKGPLWRKMPISKAFLNISSRVPSEGAPLSPRPSPRSLFREMLHPQRAPYVFHIL